MSSSDLMWYATAAIRGLVVPKPGNKIVVADLSNIEGRKLAWVANEEWKLQAFRDYDTVLGYDAKGKAITKGPDLYNITAVSIVGGDPWQVPKHIRNAFGKVPDLASGYRGGAPGYQTFARAYQIRMADHWDTIQEMVDTKYVAKAKSNINEPWAQAQITELGISDIEWLASESCKLAWRGRHPATVKFWYDLQEAAIQAVQTPGIITSAGPCTLRAVNYGGHRWLLIKLPSGRYLTYFEPRVSAGDYGNAITYMSLASEDGVTTSRAWIRTYTHGGKLTGNVCQTLAGDLLKDSMPRIEAAGYQIVFSVHDELVTECPDTSDYSAAELAYLMTVDPGWAGGLPLAAAGFETDRYFKE